MENQKRYLVVCSFIIFAENDESAKFIADRWAKKQIRKHDNRAEVVALREIPFGKLESREVL